VSPRSARDEAIRIELADWRTLPSADRDAVARLEISDEQVEFAGTIARSIATRAWRCAGARGWMLVRSHPHPHPQPQPQPPP
jgi:hypothetical protein